MKYYSRRLLKRTQINQYGELGFKEFIEYFMTESPTFVAKANKHKEHKFKECPYPKLREALASSGKPDYIYSEEVAGCTFI